MGAIPGSFNCTNRNAGLTRLSQQKSLLYKPSPIQRLSHHGNICTACVAFSFYDRFRALYNPLRYIHTDSWRKPSKTQESEIPVSNYVDFELNILKVQNSVITAFFSHWQMHIFRFQLPKFDAQNFLLLEKKIQICIFLLFRHQRKQYSH